MRNLIFLFVVFVACSNPPKAEEKQISVGEMSNRFLMAIDTSGTWSPMCDSIGDNLKDAKGNFLVLITSPDADPSAVYPKLDQWIDSMSLFTKQPVGVTLGKNGKDFAYKNIGSKVWVMADTSMAAEPKK